MKDLNRETAAAVAGKKRTHRPVRILQFGEGNFLRAFMDWMVDGMNNKGLFDGNVALVQPLAKGMIGMMKEQDYLYSLFLRGVQKGEVVIEKQIIDAVSRAVNPYEEFDAYLREAENPDLRIIISNTTEAGIVLREEDRPGDKPPVSFPGKLLLLLKRRFDHFAGDKEKGLLFFPCELIDKNGTNLKAVLKTLASSWYADEPAFLEWLERANIFFNTLVDRIVSGYPREEAEALWKELGYKDNLLDTGEIFHFLVIEGPSEYEAEFPLVQAGFNVKWCDDLTPYRTRKVRILNGAHTMTVLAAWLYGLETVKECMDDAVFSSYIKKGIFDEIIPTLDLPLKELKEYGGAILERFSNPYIRHLLLSISLNSVSKFKTRVLPSLLEYKERKGEWPALLSFSLAALATFYKGSLDAAGVMTGRRDVDGTEYEIKDSPEVLSFFAELWKDADASDSDQAAGLMKAFLCKTEYWNEDLSAREGLVDVSAKWLQAIASQGMAPVLKELLND